MAETLHKKIRLTKSDGGKHLSHKQKLFADLIIDSDGRVVKERKGVAGRRATDKEISEAVEV